jgi:hypothetical protein
MLIMVNAHVNHGNRLNMMWPVQKRPLNIAKALHVLHMR